jgi:hypothetical protein
MGAKSNQGAPATGSQSGMSMVNTGPWAPQQPYLEDAFKSAKSLYGDNLKNSFFTAPTVAGINPTQNWGQQSMIEQAHKGTPSLGAANTLNLDTLNGRYLDPESNPWLKSTFDMGANDVTRAFQTATAPQTASNFSGGGRYGSGSYRLAEEGNQRALGSTLDNLATQIYGGNYQQERNRQMNAIGNVPMLQQAKYFDPMAIQALGDQQQAQTQREYDDQRARFEYGRDNPTRALNSYLAQITGNYGQSGITQTASGNSAQSPYYTNPGATAAGGALGIMSMFGRNGAFGGKGSGGVVPGGSGSGGVIV